MSGTGGINPETKGAKMKFILTPQPKLGDTRCRRRFAFFPVRIGDTVIWLEHYEQTDVYELYRKYIEGGRYSIEAAGWRPLNRTTL